MSTSQSATGCPMGCPRCPCAEAGPKKVGTCQRLGCVTAAGLVRGVALGLHASNPGAYIQTRIASTTQQILRVAAAGSRTVPPGQQPGGRAVTTVQRCMAREPALPPRDEPFGMGPDGLATKRRPSEEKHGEAGGCREQANWAGKTGSCWIAAMACIQDGSSATWGPAAAAMRV